MTSVRKSLSNHNELSALLTNTAAIFSDPPCFCYSALGGIMLLLFSIYVTSSYITTLSILPKFHVALLQLILNPQFLSAFFKILRSQNKKAI